MNNNIPPGYPTPEDDATSLRVDIGHQDGVVILQFSKPVMQMQLTPSHTRSMAIALLQNSEMALVSPKPSPQPPSLLS